MRLLAHSGAALLALVAAPAALPLLALRPGLREGLRERLGAPRGVERGAIWIHGASVGEAVASLPLHAELAGLPPLYLGVGQIDTTSDDSTRLAERAGREGVALFLDIAPEMIHGYIGLPGSLPEAKAAMERIGDFVRRQIP